jgi:diguanylate cyclase (GGDEF)-like protein
MPLVSISFFQAERERFTSEEVGDPFASVAGQEFLHYAASDFEATIVRDAREVEPLRNNPLVTGHPGVRYFAGQPIRSPEGTMVGCVCLADLRRRALSKEKLLHLADLTCLVETELWVRRLRARREELLLAVRDLGDVAWFDPLTSLSSRRAILAVLASELKRSERHGEPIGLLMMDLDKFKPINDQHGHLVGDQVLVELSRRFAAVVRPYDTVGRFGGEEFLVVLPGVSAEGARQVAERIRRAVAAKPVKVKEGFDVWVTVSIGAATTLASSSGITRELLASADAALYRAKAMGRNQVMVHGPLDPSE